MSKVTVSRSADDDGWKSVKSGSKVLGYVKKTGDTYRARKGEYEYLGFESQKDAVSKLKDLQ